MGRKALTLARRRVRKQKNLDGTPFAPRKDKRNKRKLLEWIYSRGVVYGRDDGAKVTFRGKAAEFAFQQQFGVGRDWTPGERGPRRVIRNLRTFRRVDGVPLRFHGGFRGRYARFLQHRLEKLIGFLRHAYASKVMDSGP